MRQDPDFSIPRLGECRIPSPMSGVRFTTDDDRVLYPATLSEMRRSMRAGAEPPSMECAGPRQTLFFDPSKLACGIVTCGGLCPGLNDTIRAIVLSLHHHYGVKTVYGFRFGYEGLVRSSRHAPLQLTPDAVNRIHAAGGSVLGSSRGPQDPAEMVAMLQELRIGILFTIGGDGTLRGAQAISAEVARRGAAISVIGVPKTIDNDVSFVQKTFGFETAVTEARRATAAAHAEAGGAQRHRAGQADGPRLRVHRRVLRAGRRPRQFLPRSGGALHARPVPERAGRPARTAPPRLDRRRRRRRTRPRPAGSGTGRLRQRQARRYRGVPARCDHPAFQAGRPRDQPEVHR